VDVGHGAVCFLEMSEVDTSTVANRAAVAHQGRTLSGPGIDP